MWLALILVALIPTVIFSYDGRPLAYTEVDKSKLTTLNEYQWHTFLVDYPLFRCYAARQNKTLPVDYEVQPYCLTPTNKTYTGRPLFNGTKVDTSKFTSDSEKRNYKFLQKNPKYRCFAAIANLSLLTDYEVPPGCIEEFESSLRTQPGNIDPTDTSSPSDDYRPNVTAWLVNKSDCQRTGSNNLTVAKCIAMSITVSLVISLLLVVIYDYYLHKFRYNNRSFRQLDKTTLIDKVNTTTV